MGFKECRTNAGLSVLEVSRALCVSPAAVYQWEDGAYMPNTKRLPEIAKLFGVTVDQLLADQKEE